MAPHSPPRNSLVKVGGFAHFSQWILGKGWAVWTTRIEDFRPGRARISKSDPEDIWGYAAGGAERENGRARVKVTDAWSDCPVVEVCGPRAAYTNHPGMVLIKKG